LGLGVLVDVDRMLERAGRKGVPVLGDNEAVDEDIAAA
jgi:hypothetical protein